MSFNEPSITECTPNQFDMFCRSVNTWEAGPVHNTSHVTRVYGRAEPQQGVLCRQTNLMQALVDPHLRCTTINETPANT